MSEEHFANRRRLRLYCAAALGMCVFGLTFFCVACGMSAPWRELFFFAACGCAASFGGLLACVRGIVRELEDENRREIEQRESPPFNPYYQPPEWDRVKRELADLSARKGQP